MKNVPNDSSSDLAVARELSRKLGGDVPVPAPAETPFTRFRLASRKPAEPAGTAPREVAPVPEPARAVPAPPPLEATTGSGVRRWESLLGWVLARSGADAVFLVDDHGLLVASAGDARHGELERLGAHLAVVVERARRLHDADAPPAVSIDLGGRFLSSFTLDVDSGPLLVGALGATPLDPAIGVELRGAGRAG